jgi:hypothetical protein
VILSSCTKTASTSGTDTATLTFTANGTTYNWTENRTMGDSTFMFMTIYKVTPTNYGFGATNTGNPPNIPIRYVGYILPTISLAVNTPYTTTTTATAGNGAMEIAVSVAGGITVDPKYSYSSTTIGDFATMTFTNLHDGKADGTFTAKLTRKSDNAVINITAGQFKNITVTP